MPRYDYKCEAGHKYELQQPFGSPEEHACEKCGRLARRVLVAPPLIFKTGGYYKSSGRDYSEGSSSSSSDSPSKSGAKSESKSGDKPAAKGDSSGKAAAKKPAASKPAPKAGPSRKSAD